MILYFVKFNDLGVILYKVCVGENSLRYAVASKLNLGIQNLTHFRECAR